MQMWMDGCAGKSSLSVTMVPDHNTDAYRSVGCDWSHQSILSDIGERVSAHQVATSVPISCAESEQSGCHFKTMLRPNRPQRCHNGGVDGSDARDLGTEALSGKATLCHTHSRSWYISVTTG